MRLRRLGSQPARATRKSPVPGIALSTRDARHRMRQEEHNTDEIHMQEGFRQLVAVLALCVVTSASASASQWYVVGKALVRSEKLSETVKVEENIVLSVPSVKLAITCKEAKLTGEPIIRGIDYMYIGFLSFRSCKTTEPATGCELKTGIGTASSVEGAAAAEGTAPEDKLLVAPTGENLNEFWFNEEETARCVKAPSSSS